MSHNPLDDVRRSFVELLQEMLAATEIERTILLEEAIAVFSGPLPDSATVEPPEFPHAKH
jgi:hypothetical protein